MAKHEQTKGDVVDKPTVRLIGTDGNVFSIIGKVKKELKKAGLVYESDEFMDKAFAAHSYDEVLRICMEYVDIKWGGMSKNALVYSSPVRFMWLLRWADLNEEEKHRYAHKGMYDECGECSYFRHRGGVYSIHEMEAAPPSIAMLNDWQLYLRMGGGTIIVARLNESDYGDVEVGTIWWTNEGLGFFLVDEEEEDDEV